MASDIQSRTLQIKNRAYRPIHATYNSDLWKEQNPLLQRGEIGIEQDTYKLKIGDGIKRWNELKYVATITPAIDVKGITTEPLNSTAGSTTEINKSSVTPANLQIGDSITDNKGVNGAIIAITDDKYTVVTNALVQADWNVNEEGNISFIKNKPDLSLKLDKQQGASNKGKVLVVGNDGNLTVSSGGSTGLQFVTHDDTIKGKGTETDPLGISDAINDKINTVDTKLNKNLGSANNGKLLAVSANGDIIAKDAPTELPVQTGKAGKFLTTDGTLVSWSDLPDSVDIEAPAYANDTITLEANKIYEYVLTTPGSYTVKLPAADTLDKTKFNQIKLMLNLNGDYTVALGTTYFFNRVAIEVTAEGSYDIYYDFDNSLNEWVCGVVVKGIGE